MGVAKDRCLETSTTTGTGNVTVAGAITGYRTLASALDLNSRIDYAIEAVDGTGIPTGEWEVGEGYLSGATTLVREIVTASSNANALVNFSAGTKRVFVTLGATEWQDKGQQAARASFMAMS